MVRMTLYVVLELKTNIPNGCCYSLYRIESQHCKKYHRIIKVNRDMWKNDIVT